MKMKLTSFTLVVLVMTGLFLILYWFMVLPQFRDLATQQKQLEQLLGSTSSVSKQTTTAQQARKQALIDLAAQSQKLLPLSDQQYDLSVQLESAAKAAGVNIISLVVNAPELGIPKTTVADSTGSTSPRVTFTIAGTGSYGAVASWVTSLVGLERFIQLDQVTIGAKSPDQDSVTGTVTGFAYYLPATTP
jgi:Tfp pilus assembly protein PilO